MQRAAVSGVRRYQRRSPETGVLYQVLQEHLASFVAAANDDGDGLPAFVQKELRSYLSCGVRDVSADKAYLSHENLAAVERVGGIRYIPFKSNSGSTGSEAWERLYHLYSLHKDDFLKHYHQRSNVESAFIAIKRKFGGAVRPNCCPHSSMRCCSNASATI